MSCKVARTWVWNLTSGQLRNLHILQGAVIGVQIRWDCNLDLPGSQCMPVYTFSRLDNKDPENNVTTGYNFRFAKYYRNDLGKESRTLIKGYGIRFEIMVFGTGRKFSIVMSLLNIGAGLGLLRLLNIGFDCIVSCLIKNAEEECYSPSTDVQDSNKDECEVTQ
ncbi:P2X purinoceptor 4a-like [Brachyhypopomus gauderio]|uniref:P2X purinoceptor 4a-like n=1 Tax=Brachyhypopomus gauderio TaxID=698409 RepID=UPI004041094D